MLCHIEDYEENSFYHTQTLKSNRAHQLNVHINYPFSILQHKLKINYLVITAGFDFAMSLVCKKKLIPPGGHSVNINIRKKITKNKNSFTHQNKLKYFAKTEIAVVVKYTKFHYLYTPTTVQNEQIEIQNIDCNLYV